MGCIKRHIVSLLERYIHIFLLAANEGLEHLSFSSNFEISSLFKLLHAKNSCEGVNFGSLSGSKSNGIILAQVHITSIRTRAEQYVRVRSMWNSKNAEEYDRILVRIPQ